MKNEENEGSQEIDIYPDVWVLFPFVQGLLGYVNHSRISVKVTPLPQGSLLSLNKRMLENQQVK